MQLLEDMIDDSLSALQLVESTSNVSVDVFISTLYPETVRPPRSVGNVQLIPISCSVFTVAVGASGCEGTVAATIVKAVEYIL